MLFLGRHDYSMDERGRVPMPPRFRDELVRGVILTQGSPDHCIRGFSTEGFAKQAELYLADPVIGRQARVVRRALFAHSYQVEIDGQGRVLVPPALRRWADLEGPVVVVGIGEGFEIWNAAVFDQTVTEEQEEYAQALESLARTRLPGPV
jgi:MraZ protein